MNPAAILALISDLYTQIGALTAERDELARRLALAAKSEVPETPPAAPQGGP